MKKNFLVTIILAICCLCFSACGGPHEHKLEEEFVHYPDLIEMYTEDKALYDAEIAAENQLNVDNIAKINSEFEYILPYLPAI